VNKKGHPMHPDNAKVGLEVRIKPDISRTVNLLNGNSEMDRMAGNTNSYKIQRINNNSVHGTVLIINEYSWIPVDVIDMSEGLLEDVSLSGDKVVFDPSEI
jgi:hypothetical protein